VYKLQLSLSAQIVSRVYMNILLFRLSGLIYLSINLAGPFILLSWSFCAVHLLSHGPFILWLFFPVDLMSVIRPCYLYSQQIEDVEYYAVFSCRPLTFLRTIFIQVNFVLLSDLPGYWVLSIFCRWCSSKCFWSQLLLLLQLWVTSFRLVIMRSVVHRTMLLYFTCFKTQSVGMVVTPLDSCLRGCEFHSH